MRPCPDYNLTVDVQDITEESGIEEPVSVQDCKDYIRLEGWSGESEDVEFSQDDSLLSELITSSRQFIEQLGNVSLIPHQWKVVVTNMGMIELPFSPVNEITEILDSDGNAVEESDIKVVGNERKFLKTPTGFNLTVTYSTTAIRTRQPYNDILILVQAMYNAHAKDPATVLDKVTLWLPNYSRKPVIQ